MRRSTPTVRGFTLVEILLAVAILGILTSIAGPQFQTQLMRAKRVEAVTGLNAVWKAQRAFYADQGRYAANFDELGFAVEGGRQTSSTVYIGKRYTYQLSQPWGSTSFYCIATAELDGDDWPDVLETYETSGD